MSLNTQNSYLSIQLSVYKSSTQRAGAARQNIMSIARPVDEAAVHYERLVDSLRMVIYKRQWDMNECGVRGKSLNKWEHLICAKSPIFVLRDQLIDSI